jgi:predicted component of type VI protein secretion system
MPAFAAQAASMAYFEPLENAPEFRGQIEITDSNFTIGRDPKMAQLVFADKSVSRLHARILEENGVYQLYDEGSASGTYINFNQITLKPQVLDDNDDVHFGRVHLRFHVVPVAMDADSTQIMPSPLRPGERAPAPPVEEDLSTQPYMPGLPNAGGQPQSPPPQGAPPPPPAADDDEDDISTQPYMPHSPRR